MIARISLLLLAIQLYGSSLPFVFVYVDSITEAKIGAFPYSRDVYVEAINIAAENGAKAVVLKYFIDEPKDSLADMKLSESLTRLPVFLQCRIGIQQETPNNLPIRFLSPELKDAKTKYILAGNSGWMPLEILSKNCHDVGFVDLYTADNPNCPMLAYYHNTPIKSLPIKIFEFLYAETISIDGRKMSFMGKTYKLTSKLEQKITFPDKKRLKKYSFVDLLEDNIDKAELSGKIVILGYDGDMQSMINTPSGQVKAHDYFGYLLIGLFDEFQK